MLGDGAHWLSQTVTVSTEPAFHQLEAVLPPDWGRLYVRLVAVSTPQVTPGRTVYYDGLVLLPGHWPAGPPPQFDDTTARAGWWADRAFTNLARNASAEAPSLRVRPWADTAFRRLAGDYLSPATLLVAAFDWPVSLPLAAITANRLLKSFWALFAWANVALAPGWYWLAGGLTLAGALGGTGALARRLPTEPWPRQRALLWLGAAALLTWGTVFARGLFTVLDARVLVPVARYAFPAVIPTLLLLAAGWNRFTGSPRGWRAAWPLAAFLLLDLVSVVTLYQFYHGG
jgi:hypothetical protein